MKLSNKKIIVSTLALAMGAALAGSISGSVAWYQYSTRAAAVVNGVSAGTTGDLAISVDGTNYLHKATTASEKYIPISAKGSAGSLTYLGHPTYQLAQLPSLTTIPAAPTGYSYYKDYEFSFRFVESETTDAADATTPTGTAITNKKVYLSYFAIEGDMKDAVRVELQYNSNNALLASEDSVSPTTTGKMDLNNNGTDDTDLWDCTDASGTDVTYTNGGTYTTDAHSVDLATITDAYNITGKQFGLTDAGATKLKVRVWLEGWTDLGDGPVWASSTIGQSFNINMQFVCEANK